ncbi:Bone morphogenetic protein 7 [Bulinus truncatus]|nr:Bone morphogenetic protein 7 [Bulinus truncatus]
MSAMKKIYSRTLHDRSYHCTMLTYYLMFMYFISVNANIPFNYVDNRLGQSVPLNGFQHREQEELRKELLQLMGLPSRPKVKVNKKNLQSASSFMYGLYGTISMDTTNTVKGIKFNQSKTEENHNIVDDSDMIVSFVNIPRKASHPRHEQDRVFYFDFEVSPGERVKTAEFRLYKEAAAGDMAETFTISLYGINVNPESGAKRLDLEASLKTQRSKIGWLTFDVTQCAELWGFFPALNSGLYLKVTRSTGESVDPSHIGIIGNKGPAEKQAFLVAYMESTSDTIRRRRRAMRNRILMQPQEQVNYKENVFFEHPKQNVWDEGQCRLHSFYISFRNIGFDDKFLIAPDGYYASFCAGKCQFPMDVNANATNHAVMQMLVHTMRPDAAPVPCCAPKDYSSISLLYYDDKSSVVLKKFRDMKVKTCGCQ